jgi:1-acyl-sn-glycerol-3-phosphate acyltransferase
MAAIVPTRFHRLFYRLAGFLCLGRVTLRQPASRPKAGPIIYLGLHRNGALDGIPYLKAVPDAAYLVSAQLHRSCFGRLAFPGIPVSRAKDRERGIEANNSEARRHCVEHLRAGGRLFIMPEGTSSLGPRHLPFKPGAANIATEVLAGGAKLSLVPVAVHYECAWEWQSRAEVVMGEPVECLPNVAASTADMQAKIAAALEQTGINVQSEGELRFIEMLAYAATLGTDRSYSACLKRFESGVPEHLRQAAAALKEQATRAGALTHQGVPLVPLGPVLPYLIAWLILAPAMALFFATNLPPIVAGYVASRRLADDLNVVAFWRAAVGIPAALLWCPAVTVVLSLYGHVGLAFAYLGLGFVGLRSYYRFRKLSIALHNRFRAPQLREPLLRFHHDLLCALDHGR